MDTVKNGEVLRCTFCSVRPILAIVGRDRRGHYFLHVKVYKKHIIYGEIIVTQGTVRIKCRACERWHTIRIVERRYDVKQEELPEALVG